MMWQTTDSSLFSWINTGYMVRGVKASAALTETISLIPSLLVIRESVAQKPEWLRKLHDLDVADLEAESAIDNEGDLEILSIG